MDVPLEQKIPDDSTTSERGRTGKRQTASHPLKARQTKKKSGARDLKRVGGGVGVSAGNKTGKGEEEEGRRMARKRERL